MGSGLPNVVVAKHNVRHDRCSAAVGTTKLLSTALVRPMGLAFNSDESRLYVADAGNATSPTRVMSFVVSLDGVVWWTGCVGSNEQSSTEMYARRVS